MAANKHSRTSEANKAVKQAWLREQELVKEGKATRDWTPKQQQDILEFGKVYDDNGTAFEGQHMKSVEKYPEYQGDADNIQFLTKEEHFKAHDGNWQNSTNWYYDPVTKVKTGFGDGLFVPCKIIELSNPVVNIELFNKTEKQKEESCVELVKNEDKKFCNDEIADGETHRRQEILPSPRTKPEKFIKKVVDTCVKFNKSHPVLSNALKTTAKTLAVIGVAKGAEAIISNSINKKTVDNHVNDKPIDNGISEMVENASKETTDRLSPKPHHTDTYIAHRGKDKHLATISAYDTHKKQ